MRYKLFTLLFISILLVGTISAWDIDNVKNNIAFDKVSKINIGDKQLNYNPIWEKYAPIKIDNAFGLPIFGDTLWEGAIDEHTETCKNDCYSTININLANDGALVDDVKFYTISGDSRTEQDIRSYQFYIATSEVENIVQDYEYSCSTGATLKNGTVENICSEVNTGSHIEKEYTWKEYNLEEEVLAGSYKLKLVGEKKPSRIVDWVIETQGKTISEWAVWGGVEIISDDHGLTLSSTNSDANYRGPGIFTLENITLINVTRATGSTHGDVRLLDSSKSILDTQTFDAGGVATFNYNLTKNTAYFIVAGSGGGSGNSKYSAATYNISGTNINWTEGLNGANPDPTQLFNIQSILTSEIGGTITINSPSDNFETSNNLILFNTSTTQIGATISNMSLMTNQSGTFEIVNSTTGLSGTTATTAWNHTINSDGQYLWGIQACDSDGDCGFSANRTVSVDTTVPTINIISPVGTIEYSAPGVSIELNATITDTNLDSCWYKYNSINTTIPCVSGVEYNTTFILVGGQNSLTVYANDSAGNLHSNTTSWTANLQINNLTYNVNASETSTQTFSSRFTLLDPEISLAQLIYNGVSYTISDLSFVGNNLTLSRVIDIPVNNNPFANQTNNFSFRFTYGGGDVQNTETFYQNSIFINLQKCNTTFNTQALNYTFFDEVTQLNINGATNNTNFETSFKYWTGTGSVYKNYTYQNLSSTMDDYQFCIFPYKVNDTFKVNNDIAYSASGYRENTYYLRNATLTNVSNDIFLYLVPDSTATKFFFTFKQGVDLITDATVNVQKYFVGLGAYKTVAILTTDSYGKATMWQEVDAKYQYSVVKDGVLLGVVEKVSSCSAAPCSSTITLPYSTTDLFESYYDDYAVNVLSNLSFNRTSKIATYNFIDTTGLANYFRLEVKELRFNQSINTVCDSTLYSTAGILTCNLSDYYNSEFTARGYVSRSPEKLDETLGILISDDIIDSLGLTGIFIITALIITIVFAGAVVTKGSPSGVLFFLAAGIFILKLAGLFPFTWTITIPLLIVILYIISKLKT